MRRQTTPSSRVSTAFEDRLDAERAALAARAAQRRRSTGSPSWDSPPRGTRTGDTRTSRRSAKTPFTPAGRRQPASVADEHARAESAARLRTAHGSCSSTAAIAPSSRDSSALPDGRRCWRAWPTCSARVRAGRAASGPARRLRRPRLRRPQHGVPRRRRCSSTCRAATVVERPIHLLHVSTAAERRRPWPIPAS